MSKLKIYKASAGSGKTHSLTEEYLNLAALKPDSFKRILAVTFTNKAAEEMKQRILESLNNILKFGEKAEFYSVFERINSKAKPFEILEKVKQVRDSILHDYSYFSLSTIDSFVQKVIKSFTYEIGVESGYRIELDTEKAISEITEMLYKQIDTDKNLRNWLIHFANFKMDEGKNWDFRSEISKLSREIFKEQFKVSDNNLDEESLYNQMHSWYNALIEITGSFENKMLTISLEAKKVLSGQYEKYADLGRNIKYLGDYLTKKIADNQKLEDYVPTDSVKKMLNNQDGWVAKNADSETREIAAHLFPVLNTLLNKCLILIKDNYKLYLAAKNVFSAFHAFGILRKLAALLPDYRERHNLLMISDTTKILKEIIAGNDAPFIYEKIGNRYQHILIDEFQDTSGFQWENFKPLIKNCLSEGQGSLIVGDIKQSIYRWRGGDWSLLLSKVEKEIGSNYIDFQNLETNWRSKKNILDFNNRFFKTVSETLQQLFDNEVSNSENSFIEDSFKQQYRQVITDAYADTFQKLPDVYGKNGGRVKIQFYKKTGRGNKEWQEAVEKELPETIQTLLTQKNYHPGDLAILVRKNSEGRKIANLLLDYQQSHPESLKYQIISSESLMLSNSPVVQIIMNAIHYIYNQDDLISLHALATVYNNAFRPEIIIDNTFFINKEYIQGKKLLPPVFFDKIEKLKGLNIYETIEELCRIFTLGQIRGQLAYLQSFQDLVTDFGQNEAIDLKSFIDWWEEKGKLNSVQLSEQQDAVKILSIHKSKGLAFKVVLIPFCDWTLTTESFQEQIIWTKSEIIPFNELGIFPIIFRKYLANSIFYKEYYEEVLYSMIDALNMLYVAFTRPREELIVMAPIKEKITTISSVADLLATAIIKPNKIDGLIDLNKHYFQDISLFELKKDYYDIDGDKFIKEIKEKPTFIIENYPSADWNTKINIQHNADDFFMKSIEYIQEKVNYGTLMHELFSRIKSINDAENILDEFYYAGKIGSDERKLLLVKVNDMIQRPIVSDWFSDKWEVITEDAILDESGKIRIPDRVLIGKDKTVVIDFKFGEQYQESINQVKEYIELLKKMDYPNIKGFVYYAEKNVIETVE